MDDKIEEIISYWFGNVENTHLPTEHRTQIWFGHDPAVDAEVREKFSEDIKKATAGEYAEWENSARGTLALIILFDQFSRNIYRGTAKAYENDNKALELCLKGVESQFDHHLSLIERVFFYFPLMHSESVDMQSLSVRAFQMLVNLSFPETRAIFEKFLEYAVQHYEVVNRFGRFPERNKVLGRPLTAAEVEYLENRQKKG